MIADDIKSVRAAIGGLAGRVTPSVWEELRAMNRVLAGAQEQAEVQAEVMTVPQSSAVGILQSVRRREFVRA
jgi:hypothetical protein